jgi:hypothetical protein
MWRLRDKAALVGTAQHYCGKFAAVVLNGA